MLDLPACLAQRYQVAARLGQGAIAEVVRAIDQRTGQTVALKILYPALRDNPIVVERFRREVDLVRLIRDRHVLRIHDVVDGDGFLFLVMDHHAGGDLADRLADRDRGLPAVALHQLAQQLCGALAAAHRAGIIHRDVKPSNVLVGPGPELDTRLCDFGLARSADGAGLTSSSAVLGTPEYMAPEIIAEGHADPRSDLYSLAVVLFEAATGRVPFLADSPYQLMRLHLDAEPPRVRSLRPDLSPGFEAAIARALAKDPLDRFANADEFAAALVQEGVGTAAALVPASAAALVPGAPAQTQDRRCPACGGWVVEGLGTCADCGHQSLRLERERPGTALLVTGPGKPGDKLDTRLHVALFRLLDELPERWRPRDREAGRAPRLPFYVARQLSAGSAARLLQRVTALGLEARLHQGWALSPKEMRKKINTIAWRYFGAIGAGSWLGQAHRLVPDGWVGPGMKYLVIPALLVGLPAAFAVGIGRRAVRGMVSGPGSESPGALDPRLGETLAALASRQDRRLLARICDRLMKLHGAGLGAQLAPVADRTVQIAAAVQAVDQADAAWSGSPISSAAAQTELRRLERGRVLLRAELLRLSTHLDGLCAGLARQGAERASTDLAAARSAAENLALDVQAEHELEAFLAHRTDPR